jgi:hypothetical protein
MQKTVPLVMRQNDPIVRIIGNITGGTLIVENGVLRIGGEKNRWNGSRRAF